MAIKKGVFELYAQDRQLPKKSKERQLGESHFFDNILDNVNGSQTVHERFTNNKVDLVTNKAPLSDNQVISNPNNGSQTVHERFTNGKVDLVTDKAQLSDNQVISNPTNGSQTVHERFTNDKVDLVTDKAQLSDNQVISNPNNGSQTIHERVTNDKVDLVTDKAQLSDNQVISNPNNGSRTVHERVTSNNNKLIDKEGKDINFSFSRLIGNQRDIVLALYKNIHMNDFLTTKELTLDEISILSGVNKKSLKNTLFRLISSGYVIRVDQKIGRGGWVKYGLNLLIKNEIKNMNVFPITKKNVL